MTPARLAALVLVCAVVLVGGAGARAATSRLTPTPPATFSPARRSPAPPPAPVPLPRTGENVIEVLLAGLLLIACGILLRAWPAAVLRGRGLRRG